MRTAAALLMLCSACAAPSGDEDPADPGGGSAEQICAYLGVEILLCPSPARRMQYVSRFCEAAPANGDCRSVMPPDEGYTTTASGCERRVDYRLSMVHDRFDPVTGSCTEWESFQVGAIDCFNDNSCEEHETCVDGTCHCGDVPLPDAERTGQRCEGSMAIFSTTTCAAPGTLETVDEEPLDCADFERTCVTRDTGDPCE